MLKTSQSLHHPREYYKFDPEAYLFQSSSIEEQVEQSGEVHKDMRKRIEEAHGAPDPYGHAKGAIAELTFAADHLALHIERHAKTLKAMKHVPILVVKMMGLPAMTMVVLCLALSLADVLPMEWLCKVAGGLIFISAFSLAVLVYWAKDSFRDAP
jgi:hypothetical protein